MNTACNCDDGKEGHFFVNDHAECGENGEVIVVKLSVEGGDEVKVNVGVESDRSDKGVTVDEEGLKEDVESNAQVEGEGLLVMENREIKLESEVVGFENGGTDSNVESEVDVSVEGLEVKEASDLKPVVDEVNESSVVEEVEPDVSVDQIGSLVLDVDGNSENSVFDAQESTEVETQDDSVVNNSPDALELLQIEAQIDTAVNNIFDAPEHSADDVTECSKSSVSDVQVSVNIIPNALETSEIGANNICDGTLWPKIVFGSIDFVSPFFLKDNNLRSDIKVLPASDESSEDAGNCLTSEENSASCWDDDVVYDNKSETETVNGEIDVANKSTNTSNGTSLGSTNSSEYKQNSTNGVGLQSMQANGDHSDMLNQLNNVSASSVEGSEADSSEEENINPESVRRAFNWLVKIPRHDIGRYEEELRPSKEQLVEKTEARNSQQLVCRDLKPNLEAARLEKKTALELMLAKKKEVNLLYSLLNPANNQRDRTREKLQVQKKQLDVLRDNLSKAEIKLGAEQKKYNDELSKSRLASDICQEAYVHVRTSEKQLNQKKAALYRAQNDLRVAYNFARAGKKDSLERHCFNQVEKIMERWNKNEEFQKEYIQCNKQHMLRKLGTLDGTRLGINEVPPSLEDISDSQVKSSAEVSSAIEVVTVERDTRVEVKAPEDRLSKRVEEEKKVTPVAVKNEAISKIEEDKAAAKFAKGVEKLAARLTEERRLEEKAKAEEALKRKRENELKAQAEAELKARKEAEEKQERERRAIKNAKKKAQKKAKKNKSFTPEITEDELDNPSEPLSEATTEPEVTEKPSTVTKRSQKASSHENELAKPSDSLPEVAKEPEVTEKPSTSTVRKRSKKASKKTKTTTKQIPPPLHNRGNGGLLRHWPIYAFLALNSLIIWAYFS